MRLLTLQSIEHGPRALFLRFGLDRLRFSTSVWYEGAALDALQRESPEGAARLFFHVALFELNKLCSLRPDGVALGPYARFLTPALEDTWRQILRGVWAQWRFENDDPGYDGPVFVDRADAGAAAEQPALPQLAPAGQGDILLLCGGGKDSLVSMRLLQEAGAPFDSCAYSSSIYGPAAAQHALIDGLLDRVDGAPKLRRLRQHLFDDFLDSPVLRLHPELGVRTLTAAETPASVFGALPLVQTYGHSALCLGHERSADTGQARWARTGEDVNHQWGKSAAAEALLNGYLQGELGLSLRCFSPLKPIYDLLIFFLLRRYPEDVPFTHSCNVRKPWCLRCPKCLYVWLGCAALLPRSALLATFGTDQLLQDPALAESFAALQGEGQEAGRQPFECIGHADEARLFLSLCAARGLQGPAIDRLRQRHGPPRAALPLLERYLDVDLEPRCTAMPAALRQQIIPVLQRSAAQARALLQEQLCVGTETSPEAS
jgi:hypothetical protein